MRDFAYPQRREGTISLGIWNNETSLSSNKEPPRVQTKLQSYSPWSIWYNLNEVDWILQVSLSWDTQRPLKWENWIEYTWFQLLVSNPNIDWNTSEASVSYSIDGINVELWTIKFNIEQRSYWEADINHHTWQITLTDEQINLFKIAQGKSLDITDWFSADVLDILTQEDYGFAYKIFLSDIKAMWVPENEQTSIIICIPPETSITKLDSIRSIYAFFAQYEIYEWIIEPLEWIALSQERIEYLNINTFDAWKDFLDMVISYLCSWSDESYLEAIKTKEKVEAKTTKSWKPLSIISYKEFDRKVRAIIKDSNLINISIKKGKDNSVSYLFWKKWGVNIWAKFVASERRSTIQANQQREIIELLWCSREEWLAA